MLHGPCMHLTRPCAPSPPWVQIVLLGVCPTRRTFPGSRDGGDITLQPLPMYTVASDNVVMTSVATSKTGRIFLGGSDGHLYELQYTATDSWGCSAAARGLAVLLACASVEDRLRCLCACVCVCARARVCVCVHYHTHKCNTLRCG